jgi:hypothetical protein
MELSRGVVMNSSSESPRALVVYESMFLNTERIAESVASGLRSSGWLATALDVRAATPAPEELAELDLVVLGAPTHGFSLSRPSTRADAVRQGASAARADTGLREWLATLPHATDTSPVVAVFDTRASKVRRLPMAAGRTISKLAARRGFRVVGRPEGFLVEDVGGPLCDGEVERAAAWGRKLAETYA